jgi:hypothetical protein
VFERIILPIVKYIFYKNKEAKSSEVGTTENERRYNACLLSIYEKSLTSLKIGLLVMYLENFYYML